jgi:hypothetical protein
VPVVYVSVSTTHQETDRLSSACISLPCCSPDRNGRSSVVVFFAIAPPQRQASLSPLRSSPYHAKRKREHREWDLWRWYAAEIVYRPISQWRCGISSRGVQNVKYQLFWKDEMLKFLWVCLVSSKMPNFS